MRPHQIRWEHFRQVAPTVRKRSALKHAVAAMADAAAAGAVVSQAEAFGLHDPALEPRDEAVFALHVAAEVEHALMVQYLFAAYSLRAQGQTPAHAELIERWRTVVLQIAREEMAHLATMQNLLLVLGGPLSFGREGSPFASHLYPFRFKLQPLTLRSLAKYVTAERPTTKPIDMSDGDWELVQGEIQQAATIDNDGYPLQQVGGIFAQLKAVLDFVPDEDWRLDTSATQALFSDWGYAHDNADGSGADKLLVESIAGADATGIRTAAKKAVVAVADQGEGFDTDSAADGAESHFERFLQLYQDFKSATQAGDWEPAWPLPINPNTSSATDRGTIRANDMHAMVEDAHAEQGRITHPRTRQWAQLFNLRYRLLLDCLSHFLKLDRPLYDTSAGPTVGDRTPRGLLLLWTFNEMRHLKKLAGKLVQLPLTDDPDDRRCSGPPFELPYTQSLPDREADRWRSHRDVFRASRRLLEKLITTGPPDATDPFLKRLLEQDQESLLVADALGADQPLPPQAEKFQKIVRILDEAVRGFDIGRHGPFWSDKTLTQFLATNVPFAGQVFNPATDPSNPVQAKLVRNISRPTGWMPLRRPKIPQPRIQAIIDWIAAAFPDNDPAGQVGLHSEGLPRDESVPVQPVETPTSFATDIRPLFRPFDRSSMLSRFDLHKFEHVSEHADRIYQSVSEGWMPCDSAWDQPKIDLFKRWIDEGKQP